MATSVKDMFVAQGKALGPNPAFEDPGRPVAVTDLNLGRIKGQSPSSGHAGSMRMKQKEAMRHTQAYGGDQAMDWVFDCVRYTADVVANAEWHVEKPEPKKALWVPGEPADCPEDLHDLLSQPNPYQDYIEMMELLVIDLLLVGNAYLMKWKTGANGKPLALYRLAPPYVEAVTKPWGIGTYDYQIPNSDKLEIPPEEVIHFKLGNPDPANPYYGMGIIQGAGRAADLEISLTDSQAAYYENRALPSLALESLRRVPRDVFKKIRAQMRARMQGPKNTGELLILEAGLKLSPISTNAQDAAFAELSKMSRDRIFAWFRMSPKLLGIGDETGGRDKISDVQRQFDQKTARPLMNKMQKKLSAKLTNKPWSLDYVIDYQYQLDPSEQAEMASAFGPLPGITVDEVRKLAGLGAHPDKDIGEITLNLPGEDGEEGQEGGDTEKGIPDQNLKGEGGRPPNPSNTRAIKKGTQPKGAMARPAKPSLSKSRKTGEGKSLPELLARLDEIEAKALPVGPGAVKDLLQTTRHEEVDDTAQDMEAGLITAARVLERGLLDTIEGKSLDTAAVVQKIKDSKAWDTFEPLAEKAYRSALERVMSAANIHHGEVGLRSSEEINYSELTDKLVVARASGVAAITRTLKNDVLDAVKDAEGDLHGAIQDAISNWKLNRVPVIALTEATRGYNEATVAVAKGAGKTHVMVSDGLDHDAPCAEADGEIWTLEKAQSHSIEHPNCRRGFIPLNEDQ